MFNPINDVDVRISGHRNSGIVFAILAKFAHRYMKLVFLYVLSFLLCLAVMYPLLNNPLLILLGGSLIFFGLVILWFLCSYVHAFLVKSIITTSLDYVFPYFLLLGIFPVFALLEALPLGYAEKTAILGIYLILLAMLIKKSHKNTEEEFKRLRYTRCQIEFDYDEEDPDVCSNGRHKAKKCYVSFELRPAIVTKPGVTLFKKILISKDTLSLYVGCQRPTFIGKPFRINFQVSLIDKEGEEHFLAGKLISPMENWEHTRWVDVNTDVKKFRGQGVTICLKSFAVESSARNKQVYWGLPHTSDSSRCGKARKNILFLMDGCRPDFLGCFNAEMTGTSPAIDNFSKDTVLFCNAFSQGTWTLPSFISIFTGCFPSTTASWHPREHRPLGKKAPALAKYFKDAGCKTAALASHTRLSPNYGFSRGFDRYRYQPRNFYYGTSVTGDLFNQATQFLENTKNDDVFLLIHVFDTHPDYSITDYVLNPGEFAKFNKGGLNAIFEDEKFLFRSAIKGVDSCFSRLTEYLRIRGWYENSAIIVSADHGTGFNTARRKYGHRLYDETIKIPLLVKAPERFFVKNKIINTPVGATNAFIPTLLDINAIKYKNESDGVSLCDHTTGSRNNSADRDSAISEDIYPGHHAVTCRSVRDKLIVSFLNAKTDRHKWGNTRDDKVVEYYDIEKDPGELKNMITNTEKAERIRYLESKINNFLKKWESRI